MKSFVLPAFLIAVVSSLVTVAALEFMRSFGFTRQDSARDDSARAAVRSIPQGSEAARDRNELGPLDAADEITALVARLNELEQRLAEIEAGVANQTATTKNGNARVAVIPPATSPLQGEQEQEALRQLVLDWVGEERARRDEESERHEREAEQSEALFEARWRALEFAQEHDLTKSQEERFRELFQEMAIRTREIEQGIDYAKDSPEDVELRWIEFDRWIDQRERELTAQIDPELYDRIYGNEDDEEDED